MTKAAERRGTGGRKLTQGRQKIPIKPIVNQDARQVCFSKRRYGLFKKACELTVRCGAHVALIVFSPAGKPYSFGQPSVHAVIDRFLDPSSAAPVAAATNQAVVYEFNSQEKHLTEAIEGEARRKAALDKEERRRRAALDERLAAGVLTDDDVQRLELPDLELMLAALERVHAEAAERAHEIFAEETMMQCRGSGAGTLVHYLGAGAFTADGTGGHEAVMDTKMMLMGGNLGHALAPALPFTPVMPPPPLPPHFNHGFGYNDLNLSAGYGYKIGDGNGHGAMYEMQGFYGTPCNFFG